MTGSSAGPQALGYYFQIRYALSHILDSAGGVLHSIRVEGRDDIESIDGDELRSLLQTKHHLGNTSTMTERTVDLWRSLRAWSVLLKSDDTLPPKIEFTS
jgi:hypothetical protein